MTNLHAQTWKVIPVPVGELSALVRSKHTVDWIGLGYKGVIATSTDSGEQWKYLPFSEYADVTPRDILVDLDDSTRWYMAAGEAGYMLTTDGGGSWEYLVEDLKIGIGGCNYHKIVQCESSALVLFLLSHREVYRSTDRGITWNCVFIANHERDPVYEYEEPTNIVFDQSKPNTVYLFTRGAIRRRVSTDLGKSWLKDQSRLGGLEKMTYGDSKELLVGRYRSSDYGKTWKEYRQCWKSMPIDWYPDPGVCVYAEQYEKYFLSSSAGVFFMEASDSVWQPTSLVLNAESANSSNVEILEYDSSTGTLWALMMNQVVLSKDGGSTFDTLHSGPYLPSVNYIITPSVSGDILISNAFSTSSNGRMWEFYGLGASHPSMVAISPADSLLVVKGPVPLMYTKGGFSHWGDSSLSFIPSMAIYAPVENEIRFNPHNPHEIFGGSALGLWRITDSVMINAKKQHNGIDFVITPRDSNGMPDGRYIYQAMTFHPISDGTYYLCSGEIDSWGEYSSTVWKTTNRGASWMPLVDQYSHYYSDIVTNQSNPEIIVVATSDGILRSSDGGETWEINSEKPFKSLLVREVFVDPRMPNVYYCGIQSTSWPDGHWLNGERSGGVFVSYDYGASWDTVPLDGMNSVSVQVLHYHENPRRLIAGTSAGAYEMLLPDRATSANNRPPEDSGTLTVYPNPAQRGQRICIMINKNLVGRCSVSLYSGNGKLIKRIYQGAMEPDRILEYDLGGMTVGWYYLVANIDGSIAVKTVYVGE
jgi:photosystem II stability/assembly factor-like uncharacterized protein